VPRRALTRGFTAAATTIVLGAGLVPPALLASAQAGTTTGSTANTAQPETVVPAGARWQPREEKLLAANNSGYLAMDESSTFRWVDEATGTESPAVPAAKPNQGLGVAWTTSTVTVTDLSTESVTTSVALPPGLSFSGAYRSDAVIGCDPVRNAPVLFHILRTGTDGQVTDRPVTGIPAGARFTGVLGQSRDVAVVGLSIGGTPHTYLIGYGDGSAREIFAELPAASKGSVIVGATRVVAFSRRLANFPGSTAVYSVRLDDPAATVEQTPIPAAAAGDFPKALPVPVGDRMLFLRAETSVSGTVNGTGGLVANTLLSEPVGGGTVQTLLPGAESSYAVAPDGSVLVVGGSGPRDWAVRRVTADPGADPVLTAVRPLAPVPARIYGLAYSAGQLLYSSATTQTMQLERREVGTGPTPAVGDPVRPWGSAMPVVTCAANLLCVPMQALGTGTVAWAVPHEDWVVAPFPDDSSIYGVETGAPGNRIADASSGFVLVTSASQGKSYVADLDQGYTGRSSVSRTTTAAALWGQILWVPGTAGNGGVRPYNLLRRSFGTTFKTPATCPSFKDLQADGRWLYWSCGTTAGVYDWTTRRDIPVPVGPGTTLLGDGYLVRHDTTAGKLVLTDFHSGTAVTGDLAGLPASALPDDRGVTWSVDKYGGGIAYVDAAQNIHVVPLAGITRQPLGVLRSVQRGAALGGSAVTPFTGEWSFSRPTGGWTLSFRNSAGQVVAMRSGTARTGTTVHTAWDLTTAPDRYTRAGTYSWTLTARPLDGQGPTSITSGTLLVGAGPSAIR
jgi:hypothetical protein